MKTRLTGIILLIAFTAVLLQPLRPFVEYYLIQENTIQITSLPDDLCCCETASHETAKMENNGDAYLKALVKRVCDQKEKEKPAVPIAQITVFVSELIGEDTPVYHCPEKNYNNKISTFIIQPDINSYVADIFHPPANS